MDTEEVDDIISTWTTKGTIFVHGSTLSKDNTLKYDFMTSLENIAVAKIVTCLWMNRSIQREIANMFFNKSGQHLVVGRWKQIKNQVLTRLSKLPLANSIVKKLINVVPVIGESMIQWILKFDFHIFDIKPYTKYSAVQLINNITWTARGKIDHVRTARNILSNKYGWIYDHHKYFLACTFCLEDELEDIAPKVVKTWFLDCVEFRQHPMVYYWTDQLTNRNTKLYNPLISLDRAKFLANFIGSSVNERIFKLLAGNDGKLDVIFHEVPMRHMWSKLTENERAKKLFLGPLLYSSEIKYSILSNLNYEQQQEVFKRYSHVILCDILNDWVWEGYFLPTALHILDIINPSFYLMTMEKLHEKMMSNSQEENKRIYDQCKYLFKILWQKSSKSLKDYAVKQNEVLFVSLPHH